MTPLSSTPQPGARRLGEVVVAVLVAVLALVLSVVLLAGSAPATVDAQGDGGDGGPVRAAGLSLAGGATTVQAPTVRTVPAAPTVPIVPIGPTVPVVRSVVSAGSGPPTLVQAQVREQRTSQLQAMFQGMLTTQPLAPVTDEADPRVDQGACRLLGRTWTEQGCSRQSCLAGQEYAKSGANAEVCRIGGRRGASYGVEVDFRRCDALHRTWIGLLNYCAADPHRDQVVVRDAPQCRAPYTTYVLVGGREGVGGRYDECLRPSRVAQLDAIARAEGRALGDVVAERSAAQCGWRAQQVYVDGVCRPGTVTPTVRDNVVVVGDSITWRGTNELATLQPDWVIDGSSGRQVDALDARLAAYRTAYGEPGGVIFALGTNGRSGWTEEQFRASVASLPAGTPVLFVTPFREPGGAGRPQLVDSYAGWMQRLVAERPTTCLADWRSAVSTDDQLLVDGVHPTSIGEVYWAELVDSSWSDCLSRNGLTSS